MKLGFFASTDLITNHPDEDLFWSLIEKSTDYPDSISVPLLVIGGWFDHFPDDVLRSFDDLRTRSDVKVRSEHKLMMGPWLHTGIDKANQGELDYSNAAGAANDRALQFFAYYLQGAKNGYPLLAPVQYYQMGTNEWRTTNDWHALANSSLTFYLQTKGEMNSSPPIQTKSYDSLLYDPRNPSPAVGGARFNPFDKTIPIGPVDIRQEVESRSDALVFSTDPLSSDLLLDGPVSVELFVSSDRTDTDFSARLCDVYPDGRSMIMTQGIRRARFRNAYDKEELMIPGQMYRIIIGLQNIGLTLLKNHRLRIVISSSDYPHYDINLNNGGALYKAGDTLVAANYVYHEAAHPSHIVLSTFSTVRVDEPPASEPQTISLYQNNPNPCMFNTTFRFRINGNMYEFSKVKLRVVDLLGREVALLLEKELSPGEYAIPFDTGTLRNGVYFYQLTARNNTLIKSMMVIK